MSEPIGLVLIALGIGLWVIGRVAETIDNLRSGKPLWDAATTEYTPRRERKYAGKVGPVEGDAIAFTVQGHRANRGRIVTATLDRPDGGSDDFLEYLSARDLAKRKDKAAAAGVEVDFGIEDVEAKYSHFVSAGRMK